jgi:hypothetical protein
MNSFLQSHSVMMNELLITKKKELDLKEKELEVLKEKHAIRRLELELDLAKERLRLENPLEVRSPGSCHNV